MCAGPYWLESWNTGSTVEMSTHEGYWGGGASLVTEPELHYIDDESILSNALVGGELDGAYCVPVASVEKHEKHEKHENAESGELLFGPSTASVGMGSATSEGPAGDARFREAIGLALDQGQFIDAVLGGMGYPVKTFALPMHFRSADAMGQP